MISPPLRSRTAGQTEFVRPLLNLWAKPQHASPAPEHDDRSRHIGVAALVQADVSRLSEAEDPCYVSSVDEVCGVDEWRHGGERISGFGSVRPAV